MYAIVIDARDHLLDITTSGFWAVDEARRYAAELRISAATVRKKRGQLRVVVNALDASVQSGDVMTIVAAIWNELLVEPGDRVALMVESSLAKMQAKRVFTSDHWQAFLSPSAARIWLTA